MLEVLMSNNSRQPQEVLNSQPWLEEIIENATLAKTVDREGAAIALGKLLGRPVSPETVRRWPIPYKVVAACARYELSDVIAYAQLQYENAPRRMGRRSRVTTSNLDSERK
jgi:hypothetical protein